MMVLGWLRQVVLLSKEAPCLLDDPRPLDFREVCAFAPLEEERFRNVTSRAVVDDQPLLVGREKDLGVSAMRVQQDAILWPIFRGEPNLAQVSLSFLT
jgi:hypothetical protein